MESPVQMHDNNINNLLINDKLNIVEIEISCKDKVATIILIYYKNMKKKNKYVINLKAEESKVENVVKNLWIKFINLKTKMD